MSENIALKDKLLSMSLHPAEENRFTHIKRRLTYASLVGLTTLSILFGYEAHKKSTDLSKAQGKIKELQETAAYFQKDAADLTIQRNELRSYAYDAQTLGESIKFYPTEHDFISALPENEQEKALKKVLEEDAKELKKHNEAIATLGIDTNLLFRVQSGPKLEK